MTSSVDDLVAGRRGSTVVFVVTTFGLTWLVWTPLAIAALGAPELPQVPLIFFAGSFGPLAGALAASAYSGGWRGVRSWAGRTFSLRFRRVWWWWAIGMPVAYGVAGYLTAAIVAGGWPEMAQFGLTEKLPGWNVAAVATVWVLIFGLGEEAGWRGWLLPHLARRFSTFWAALIVAGVWIVWHAPAFVFNPTYREMGPGIVGWMLALVAGSYLLAWLARGARWSIVPVLIWHGGFDLLTASDQAAGTIAAVISAIVMVQGVIAAGVLWRSRNLERGGATGPRPSVSSGPGR
jgi:membrane protease YdiL (CAAX protease family)